MNIPPVIIVPFNPVHQQGVDELMSSIVPEFETPFIHQPVKPISDLYEQPGRSYWVALADGRVAGTAGVIVIDGFAVLKSFFVARLFRGQYTGVAAQLLHTALTAAVAAGACEMYLGTMPQFKAAARFYEKNGFCSIAQPRLPARYPHNLLDTVFYHRPLTDLP